MLFVFLATLCAFHSIIHVHAVRDASPIVPLDCGSVQGEWNNDWGTYNFLGIPYAAPPVGSLRWHPTLSLQEANMCENHTREARHFGSGCKQEVIGDEDCLFLNIWTTSLPNANSSTPFPLRPVMVFIHGGDMMIGSGADIGWRPYRIARDSGAHGGEVISISINYRLNAFGFLSLDVLSQNDPRGVSGNYGFLDMIQALKWIQTNIAAFGGDKDRVTIYGQSSGGTAVLCLIASPLAAGLFHRAISMSGSPRMDTSLASAAQQHMDDYVATSPCAKVSSSALLKCLYDLSTHDAWASVNRTVWQPDWEFGLPYSGETISPLPVVDGVVFPYSLQDAFELGKFNDVPTIIGIMHEEVDLMPMNLVDKMSASDYLNFITNRFNVFGPNFTQSIIDLYPLKNYLSQQQHYDVIASDVRDGCGNLALAKLLASHSPDIVKGPLYVYVGTEFPEKPLCLEFWHYCSRYSFHILDLWTLMQDIIITDNQEYANLILSRFVQFAYNGSISSPSWAPFYPNSATVFPVLDDETYYVTLLQKNETLQSNHNSEQCAFWSQNDFWSNHCWQN